jgi:hypothetical protein
MRLPSYQRPRGGCLVLWLAASVVTGCRGHVDSARQPGVATDGGPQADAVAMHEGDSAGSRRRGVPCGDLACTQYESPADAFVDVMASAPLVLAVGEVHAPKGARVPSAARRFAETLLPLLRGRASDLLLELMMPPAGCVDAAAEVRTKQRVVTSHQAETDQDEYVQMGDRARALGIVPDMLRPTCADVEWMRGDHGDRVAAALETIARLTSLQAKRLVARDEASDADAGKIVVVYGGALHNDLAPAPEKARWTYAPELDAYTRGRLVAVDLVVPEFIGDDETWRALPWRAAYDPDRLGAKTTLFRLGDRSFVLVFARSP